LEKPYLRLTKEPDPSTIRPEPILKKSLKMLLDKWAKKEASYAYIAEQFRSIRQVIIEFIHLKCRI
jgi:SAC3/GANP/Nin1/mts3/eIF-3 p25 family.